ncbi:hypothetical protein M407DRAFT_242247 [Tulasnella calospora MUT 4182]|uniref:PWWP domain-containing protein n=1 Tax=Tulasnella calospora MUT 4182 TaxID=1051891 RepID=A0A0C3M9L1_9AGAM|nr:hypothetical protein M407DRAFT_242247 [Tulasnella calospora MUT 4182]
MSTKKATKAQAAEATYSVKDIVLAKVKGYPPWPAMVVDPENVAKHVKKERPISKKTTFYCVRFFPAGDYSWAVAKDLSRLQQHEIEAYINEPSKKNSELKRGYEVALNPTPWIDEIERKEADAEAAAAEEEEGVDQLEDSEGGGEEEVDSDADSASAKKKKPQAGKKRKHDSISAEDGKKKRKNAQEALSAKRRPVAGSKKAAKGKASSADNAESEDGVGAMAELEATEEEAGRKKGRTSRGKADDSDEKPGKRSKKDKDEDDADDPLANDPDAQRVKDWRHKLQRGFLTGGKPPQAADMPLLDQIFSTVENYPNLTIEYLQFSKIGKVMRRIAGLNDIPRDDEFHFKERAQTLVLKWQAILQEAEQAAKSNEVNGKPTEAPETSTEPSTDAKSGEPKPAVNGVHTTDGDAHMTNGDADAKKTEDSKEEAMDMSDS